MGPASNSGLPGAASSHARGRKRSRTHTPPPEISAFLPEKNLHGPQAGSKMPGNKFVSEYSIDLSHTVPLHHFQHDSSENIANTLRLPSWDEGSSTMIDSPESRAKKSAPAAAKGAKKKSAPAAAKGAKKKSGPANKASRDKNNAAVRRCRTKKRAEQKAIEENCWRLEVENDCLEINMAGMEKMAQNLRTLLFNAGVIVPEWPRDTEQ